MGRLQRIRAAIWPKSPEPLAAVTWEPGDLAECIWGNWRCSCGCGATLSEPGPGQSFLVDCVELRAPTGELRQYLGFARWPNAMFDARGFRKLTPRADALEAADAAFLEQLKPATLPVPATAAIRPIAHRPRRIFP